MTPAGLQPFAPDDDPATLRPRNRASLGTLRGGSGWVL
jgi:hypothetical protein